MTNAKHDNNGVPAALGLSNSDGATLTPLKVDPSSHTMNWSDGTTGSDLSGDNASRDENGNHGLIGVSSADGVTPVPVYIDPADGSLLVKST